MALKLDQVVEGVGAAQLAGVDQAHEQIPNLGAVQGAIVQGVLAMKNRSLQSPFYYVVVCALSRHIILPGESPGRLTESRIIE